MNPKSLAFERSVLRKTAFGLEVAPRTAGRETLSCAMGPGKAASS